MEKILTEEDLSFVVEFTELVRNLEIIQSNSIHPSAQIAEIANLKKTLKELKDTKCPMNRPLCAVLEYISRGVFDENI